MTYAIIIVIPGDVQLIHSNFDFEVLVLPTTYDLRNHSLQTRSKTERLESKLLYSVKQTIKGFQWIAPFNNNPIHRDSHDRTNRTNNQRQKYWISKRWFSAGFIDKRDRETVWQDEDDIWPFYHFDLVAADSALSS